MKNAITYILAATIVLAFSGFAADQNSGGQKTKKKGPPNTTRTNGGNNGKTNRKTVRKPTNGGQNNNGKTNGGNNGGKNNNGKTNGGNNGNNNNKPTQKKKKQPSLSELLGLTGEVAEKFEQLRKRLHETVKAIAESDMSNEDKAVKIRVAHKKYRDALKELLSEEQLAKLRLIHLKRAESHNKNKKHHHHFGPFIAKALKLTEEQLKKLGAVRHHACEKRYKVLSNKNLSEEEKKVALKEINEQVRARTAEILTEEQLAMLKEINAKARKMSGSNGKKKSTGNPE
jgi:Spy/CpxP family protein refolding chaperone